jgi:hypothetical protein
VAVILSRIHAEETSQVSKTCEVFSVFWTLFGRLIPTMRAMDNKISPSQHLFVVRLWTETTQIPQVPLRGSVEHVLTGQKFYFTSLDDLSDFIALKAVVSSQLISKEKENRQ